MAQRLINIGTGPNTKDGDTIRNAFDKVNQNFGELYTAVGQATDGFIVTDIKGSVFGNDSSAIIDANNGNINGNAVAGITVKGGAIELSGNSISTTDSTAITVDQEITFNSRVNVSDHVYPLRDNTYDLGSPDKQWKSLYVSGNTIYIAGTPLSIDEETNQLKVNNIPISQTILYEDIPNVPTDVSDLTDTQGLLGGGGNPFDQDLNTDDSVTFDSVGATTVNVSQINGTNPGDELVIQANNNNWNFGTDGSLSFPGTLDYRIGENFGGGSLAITSEGTVSIFTNSIESFKAWTFNTNGNLELPEGGEIRFSYGYIDQDTDVQGNALRISGGNSVIINTDEDGKTWEFDYRGTLRLPLGGDIINSSGQSVLGGGSYTPEDPDDWDSPAVNTVQAALDELAAKVAALQNFEIDGGNAYTPALGELLIDGNGA